MLALGESGGLIDHVKTGDTAIADVWFFRGDSETDHVGPDEEAHRLMSDSAEATQRLTILDQLKEAQRLSLSGTGRSRSLSHELCDFTFAFDVLLLFCSSNRTEE